MTTQAWRIDPIGGGAIAWVYVRPHEVEWAAPSAAMTTLGYTVTEERQTVIDGELGGVRPVSRGSLDKQLNPEDSERPASDPVRQQPPGDAHMAQFMDVHTSMAGVTQEQLTAAHQADLDIQADEGVNFVKAWADPQTGHVFCLSEAPNAEAVRTIHKRAGHPPDEVHEITVTA